MIRSLRGPGRSGLPGWLPALLFTSGCLAGCGISEAAESFDGNMAQSAAPSGAILGGDFGSPGATDPTSDLPAMPSSAVPNLPPEVELSLEFEQPQAGERYVYAANPASDNVAVIDATTLGIMAVEAGDQPTFLQTLGGKDAAVVLNVASSDASIIRTSGGKSTSVSVPVQAGANAIAVSPSGEHAVVFYDALHRGAGVTGSYQDLSVLFLARGKEEAIAMTVGFRPSGVRFSADGERAFVVTEDGVSLLDFDEIHSKGAHIAETLPLGDNAGTALDVSVTPDGSYALARREGESQLRLLNLESGEVQLLDLTTFVTPPEPEPEPVPVPVGDAGVDGGPPVSEPAPAPAPPAPVAVSATITDVDLAPSGEFALAVVRDQSTVLKVPIPEGFTDPSVVESFVIRGEIIGSVDLAPDSRHALLYTTAASQVERLSVLDVETGAFDTVRLAKAVERVTISDDSRIALVVHQKLDGNPEEPGLDPDLVIDRSYGYSVVDLESGFSKLQTSLSPVGPATVVPTGTDLFVLFNDASRALFEVHQVDLASFLVERVVLGSPPTSIGAVPGSKRVFIGQDHPDGRISFIDWETGELESVTGFELNSRIRE